MKWAVAVGTMIAVVLCGMTEASALIDSEPTLPVETVQEPAYPRGSVIIESVDVGRAITLATDSTTVVKEYISLVNTTDMLLDLVGHEFGLSYAKSTAPCDQLVWTPLAAAKDMPPLPSTLAPYQSFTFILSGSRLHNTDPGVVRLTERYDGVEVVHDTVGWQGSDQDALCSEGRPLELDDLLAVRQINTYSSLPVDTDDNAYDFNALPEAADQTEPEPGDDVTDDETPPEATLEDATIQVTEILADPSQPDNSDEFIELYNPTDRTVDLAGYRLETGATFAYTYVMPSVVLPPDGFVALYAHTTHLVLSNTGGGVRVTAPSGRVTSEMTYDSSVENVVWAWADESWQQSQQATPGAANIISELQNDEDDDVTEAVVALAACGEGRYRNPLTNRCRSIDSDAAILTTCGADEYRNPETNRCRKIAVFATALTPCSSGSERNPETNRCRKVAGVATELAPCQAGYERNPETNRCRKAGAAISPATVPAATAAAEPSDGATLKNALLITAGVGVAGYGLYEWRSELWRLFHGAITAVSRK